MCLLPYIGKAGLWLLWLLTFMVSLVLIFDDIPDLSFIGKYAFLVKEFIAKKVKELISRFENPFFDKQSTEIMTTMVLQIKFIHTA